MTRDSLPDALCRELAGVEGIPKRFVDSVMRRARLRFGSSETDRLLHTFDGGGLDAVMASQAEAGIARAILFCLYTGLLADEKGDNIALTGPTALTAEDYFESLMWRVVQAHPPGLSGGYFGHWHYLPEDA